MQNGNNGSDAPSVSDHDLEQLKLLFDYTKFHIGLYATLVTLLIAMLSLGANDVQLYQRWCLFITTVFFVLAGACGGVVASNIPNFRGMSEFRNPGKKIGPKLPWKYATEPIDGASNAVVYAMCLKFGGPIWATWEHLFFWVGIAIALIGLFLGIIFPGESDAQVSACGTAVLECRPK